MAMIYTSGFFAMILFFTYPFYGHHIGVWRFILGMAFVYYLYLIYKYDVKESA